MQHLIVPPEMTELQSMTDETGTDETDFPDLLAWIKKPKSVPTTPAHSAQPSSASSSSEDETDCRRIRTRSNIVRLVGNFGGGVERAHRLNDELKQNRRCLRIRTGKQRSLVEHLCHRFRNYCEKRRQTQRAFDPDAIKVCGEMALQLLSHGAEVDNDVAKRRRSALHNAVVNVDFPIDAFSALFAKTKFPNAKDRDGNTPLHLAFKLDGPESLCPDRLHVMFRAGCELDVENDARETPLDLFMSMWKDVEPTTHPQQRVQTILHLVSVKASQIPNFGQCKHAWSLLCLTLLICPADSAKVLMERGISTESEQSDDSLPSRYPFPVAAVRAANESKKKFELICKHIPSFLGAHDAEGRNVAHHAAEQGDVELLKIAKSNGVDLTKEDKAKYRPLHRAASAGSKALSCLNYLIDHSPTGSAKSALTTALENGNRAGCKALLRATDSVSEIGLHKLRYETLQILTEEDDFVLESANPLRVCLELSREFVKAADDNATYRQDFNEMAQNAEILAVDLLSGCQPETVKCVVNGKLIDYAIAREQKQFIASPAIQEYISQTWSGCRSQNLKKRSTVADAIRTIFYPFCAGKTIPRLSFISKALSLIVFLILLILGVVYNSKNFHGASLTPLDWTIFVFFVAFVVHKIRKGIQLYRTDISFSKYLAHRQQKIVDVILLCLFAAYFVLCFVGFYGSVSSTTRETLIRISFHVYGVAVLGYCINALTLLQFHSRLGPIQVSFISISKVTFMFLVILCAFWTGFALSITSVHTAHAYVTQNATFMAEENFLGIWRSLRSLFWALFGMIEVDLFELNTGPEDVVSMLLLGVWLVVSVIILLNMLIALINNSFQRVEDNSDLEWKFARANVVRDMALLPMVPVPLNLVMIPFEFIVWLISRKKQEKVKESKPEKNVDKKFQKEMKEMVERYRERRVRQRKKDGASKGDLSQLQNELQQQMFEMRKEIKGLVKELVNGRRPNLQKQSATEVDETFMSWEQWKQTKKQQEDEFPIQIFEALSRQISRRIGEEEAKKDIDFSQLQQGSVDSVNEQMHFGEGVLV